MSYVLAPDGVVERYPYSFRDLRKDNPQVSFPREPSDERLAEFGVHRVTEVAHPAPSDISKNVVEGEPVLVDGVWTQVWQEVDASAEEIAARQEDAAQSAELGAAKVDAWIIQYLAMSPDEARQWVENNTANLAALRTVVGRLAYAQRVLIRREFR